MNEHTPTAQHPCPALRSFMTEMHDLAKAHKCHGWQMKVLAAENGPKRFHTPRIEASLIRITNFCETHTGGFENAAYDIEEIKHLMFSADGNIETCLKNALNTPDRLIQVLINGRTSGPIISSVVRVK